MSKPVVTHIISGVSDVATARVGQRTLILTEDDNTLYRLHEPWNVGVVFSDVDKSVVSKQVIMSMATLLAVNWVANQQAITVVGVTADNLVLVRPADTYIDEYIDNGLEAISQADDSITFECDITPVVDIDIMVFIFGSNTYAGLEDVAYSGSYTDLTDKPDILAITETPITIAVSDWSGTTATKTVTGVTADSSVDIIYPTREDSETFSRNGLFVSHSGTDLTFTAKSAPADDINLIIEILK